MNVVHPCRSWVRAPYVSEERSTEKKEWAYKIILLDIVSKWIYRSVFLPLFLSLILGYDEPISMKSFEGIGSFEEESSALPDVDSSLRDQQELHRARLMKDSRETSGQKREWARAKRDNIIAELNDLTEISQVEKRYPSSQP